MVKSHIASIFIFRVGPGLVPGGILRDVIETSSPGDGVALPGYSYPVKPRLRQCFQRPGSLPFPGVSDSVPVMMTLFSVEGRRLVGLRLLSGFSPELFAWFRRYRVPGSPVIPSTSPDHLHPSGGTRAF